MATNDSWERSASDRDLAEQYAIDYCANCNTEDAYDELMRRGLTDDEITEINASLPAEDDLARERTGGNR